MTDTLKIEAGKEYLLRNGWRMRCYATGMDSTYPTHGAYFRPQLKSNGWSYSGWNADGSHPSATSFDIISEAPETIEVDCWAWVYADGGVQISKKAHGGPMMAGANEIPAAQFRLTRSVTVGEGM
jgi:hypothetical protein